MTGKLLRKTWIVLFLMALLLLPYAVVQAQSALKLNNLLVEVWPEYDRPEVLVIYRGELDPTTPLPASLTFRLPGYIENMFAVAYEENNGLVDVSSDTIQLRPDGSEMLLTFTTPSLRIQFEYYDPVILTKQGQTRQLNFNFVAPYETTLTTFEVQEPFGAQNFSLTPPADSTFVGAEGLRYNNIEVTGLTPGDTFAFAATYQRSTDDLSVDSIGNAGAGGLSGGAPSQPVNLDAGQGTDFLLGYVLIGAGVVLLAGTGVYWWWSTRRRSEQLDRRRPPRSSSRRPAARSQKQSNTGESSPSPTAAAVPEQVAGYCYRCGTPLRPDSNFCHVCGAERRGD